MAKVVIAEDDLYMADMLEEVLVDGGYEVCGIARTVENAVELCKSHQPDLAVVDIRLANGGLGTEIPAQLKGQDHMGILYASGHVGQMVLTETDGVALLTKPYRPADVVRSLKIVEQVISAKESSRQYPHGFSLLKSDPSKSDAPQSSAIPANKRDRRAQRQQNALARFGSFALSEGDIAKVLIEAASVCADCMEAPICTVFRYRPGKNDLLAEAGVGWNQGVTERLVSHADATSPHGRAFITKGAMICRDLSDNAGYIRSQIYVEHGVVTTLDVIIGNAYQPFGLPYGILEIASPLACDYDSYDVDFLSAVANIVAGALYVTKRNADFQVTVDRLRDMVDDRNRSNVTKNALLEEKSNVVDEKVALVQDVQHRIRSNFQLVYSMLIRQIGLTTDKAGIDGLGAIARRVMALVQIYDIVLRTGLSRTIDFGAYLSSLCTNFAVLENDSANVKMFFHTEPVLLDLNGATTLGLVMSELIANSYAHAFPNGTGTIDAVLSAGLSGGNATIVFADDGIGFKDIDYSKHYGLALVNRLMEQIGGSATVRSDQGTSWTLNFPVPPAPTDPSIPDAAALRPPSDPPPLVAAQAAGASG